MQNIALYSNFTDLNILKSLLTVQFGKVKEEILSNGMISLSVVMDKSFVSSGKTLTFNCRQREVFDYELRAITDEVTQNLAGMMAFLDQLPIENQTLLHKVKMKITTVNTEIAVMAQPVFNDKFKTAVDSIIKAFDALIFSGQNNFFPNAATQGFYNKNFDFLFDLAGDEADNDIEIVVQSQFFDKAQSLIGKNDTATSRQQGRKEGAEQLLVQSGVPINKNLPYTPDASQVRLRSKDEVVDRLLALFTVAVKAEGLEGEPLQNFAQNFNVLPKFTPDELAFFNTHPMDEQEKVNFLWRYESVWTLFWALGFVTEEYAYPKEICNVEGIAKTIFAMGEVAFREKAELREVDTILDQLDLTYRCHWAVTNARVKNQAIPGEIDPSIIYERHYALNWLTQNGGEIDWDKVLTNT